MTIDTIKNDIIDELKKANNDEDYILAKTELNIVNRFIDGVCTASLMNEAKKSLKFAKKLGDFFKIKQAHYSISLIELIEVAR